MDTFLKRIPFRGKPPILLKIRSSKLYILLAVCISIFTDIFLYGVIVPVIPFALRERVHVPPQDVQHWVSVLLAVYGAALLVLAPICGIIADRTSSRRAPLLVGLVVLAGATLMLCLGKTIPVLVVGRVLQGGSAAVVWTVALALLSDTVGKEESGKAIGYVSLTYSVGILIAPLLGGVVYDRSGYYAVYGMTFGIIALDIILRLLLVEKKVAAEWLVDENDDRQRNEVEAREQIGIALEPMDAKVVSNAEAEKTAVTGTVAQTQKPKRRLPPILTLLKSRRILAAFWGNMVMAATMGAFDAVLPIFVNRTFGWNSLGGGLIFLAPILPSFGGPVIGSWTDKYGPRWIAAGGLVFSLPFWVLLRLVDHDDLRQKVLLCALLVFIGLAAALVLTSLMTEFSKVCDAKEKQQPDLFGGGSAYAQSYGIFTVSWAAGTLIGPLWAAGVQASAGWKTLTWSLGLFNAVSAIPVILYSGGFINRKKPSSEATEERREQHE